MRLEIITVMGGMATRKMPGTTWFWGAFRTLGTLVCTCAYRFLIITPKCLVYQLTKPFQGTSNESKDHADCSPDSSEQVVRRNELLLNSSRRYVPPVV